MYLDPNPPTIPNPNPAAIKSNFLLLTLLAIIITGIVSGVGVYTYEQNQQSAATQDLQSQVNTLRSQLAVKSAASATTTTPTPALNTYTNTAYGYSFHYPTGYVAEGTVGDAHLLPLTGTDRGVYIITPTQIVQQGGFNDISGNFLFSTLYIGSNFSEAAVRERFSPGDTLVVSTTTLGGASAYKVIITSSTDKNQQIDITTYFVKTASGAVIQITLQNQSPDAITILHSFQVTK
ncbi:hypothetical protein KGQ71_03415 [Patescibacteria group bacterium]|nr:hypothetical protein [Patescibacteria group bacterium]